MTDTLSRLTGPIALTAAAATVYTAPAASVVTVRSILVANETAGSQTFRISLGADGAGKRLFYDIPVAPGTTFSWNGALVLVAEEVLQAYANAATSLTLTISGVLTS